MGNESPKFAQTFISGRKAGDGPKFAANFIQRRGHPNFEKNLSKLWPGPNYALAAFADAFLAGELSPHVKPDPRDE